MPLGAPQGAQAGVRKVRIPESGVCSRGPGTPDSELRNCGRAAGAAIEGLKDVLAPDQVEQKVESTLLGASDGALPRTAQEAARQAVFVGGISAIKQIADEAVEYVRIEAMDDHACGQCWNGNGTK